MMIKAKLAFGALMLGVSVLGAAPAAAQMAAGPLPKCSATVRDSCDQGANNPKAMSAEQAMKSGGVGDRAGDHAAKAMPMTGKPMHKKHHAMAKTTTTATTATTAPQ